MRQEKYFKELKRRVDIVSSMLADPQPGLASWGLCLGQNMKELNQFWNDEKFVTEVDKRIGES